jgi:plastocyanin
MFAFPWILSGCGRRPKAEQQAVELYTQTDGDLMEFRPNTLTCPTGELVHLTFHHAGRFVTVRHDWMLTYPDKLESLSKELADNDGVFSKQDPRIIAVTPLCDRGGTVTVWFTAPPPGNYPFLCSTHPEDMRGVLHVGGKHSTH